MSVETIEIRKCDCCHKPLTGRLTWRTCPCCGKDICLACQSKQDAKDHPEKRRTQKPPLQDPNQDKLVSFSLRGVFWDGETKQKAIEGMRHELARTSELPLTAEEEAQIAEFLKG